MTSPTRAFEKRFRDYMDRLADVIGHQDRHAPLRGYIQGLCLPGERKSVEPMAARVDPHHAESRHQSMHHFVAESGWDDAAVMQVARSQVLDVMERHGPVEAWIIDDTGIPKKGTHSVGVARQYCGAVGKPENCQVAVSISLANQAVSVPAAYRLYLPEVWARDPKRRRKAGIPKHVRFQTKWEIALGQIDSLCRDELPRAPIVADAGYGVITEFRDELTRREIPYVLGITGETSVWAPGEAPLPPKPRRGLGRTPVRMRRTPRHHPLAARALAEALPRSAWKWISWREGTRGTMRSRFAWVRVRPAHGDQNRHTPRPIEWLLIAWPRGEAAPTKFWLSTLPETTPGEALVRLAHLRWRIERDYEELKDEIGLDHFEGRGWRGFHHHGSLCIAAYAFLAAERARLSPPEAFSFFRSPPLPKGFKPRGSPHTT
jgi:SRSO17 transposase